MEFLDFTSEINDWKISYKNIVKYLKNYELFVE